MLNLYRTNFLLVGGTSKNAMRLLPSSGESHTQKVAVADLDGNLHVFSVKKEGIQLSFKISTDSQITCLELGGPEGSSKDKIFITAKNKVLGYTKKGKPFFDINTNLTEPIKRMKVCGKHIFICGKYICNHYENGVDTGYMVYEDEINDLACINFEEMKDVTPVIALKDGKIIFTTKKEIKHKVDISVQATVLHVPQRYSENNYCVIVGTLDGRIGQLNIQSFPNEASDVALFKWMSQDSTKTYNDTILCLDTYDLTGDGTVDLLVGRKDGSIEIFSMEDEEALSRRFIFNCNESVTSIQAGMITNPDTAEVVVTTTSGWIFGLTSYNAEKQESLSNESQSAGFSREARHKILQLRSEINELEQKVACEREKYFYSVEDRMGGMFAIPLFHVNCEMVMVKEKSSYLLTVETQVPLDNVLLQSDVPLDLKDVERNSAVVSYSKCEPESGNCLLASYRCQVNARRLQVEVLTTEGYKGTLRVYITPQIQPKSCRLLVFLIRPLSLHSRCNSIDESRSQNTLLLKGNFSITEIHSWMHNCLPEVPEKFPEESEIKYLFRSYFTQTQLQCTYSKGKIEFKSDNISTISILKDVISKEATKKNITLEITFDLNKAAMEEVLNRLDAYLTFCLSLSKKVQLIDALNEILDHNPGSSKNDFEKEYRDLLDMEGEIRREINNHPHRPKRIKRMITDLYIDYYKFMGVNVKGKIPQIIETLEDYSLTRLLDFFNLQQ